MKKMSERVQIKLFKKQRVALRYFRDRSTTEIMYGGGARGGKSFLGCFAVISAAASQSKSSYMIARAKYSDLRDTTLITFFEVLNLCKLRAYCKHNAQTHRMEFANGSIVFFREIKYLPSDPNFDRLGSYDLTGVFLDECQQIHYKAVSVLRGRLSKLRGDGWETTPKMLFTCNPAKNWIYSDYYKPSRDNELPEYRKFIKALATDNPHVPPEYIEQLKRSDRQTVERLLYGNFDYDDDPNALCGHEDIESLFTNVHVLGGRNKKYITADIAGEGSDMFVIMVWYGWAVVEIQVIEKSTGRDAPQYIKRAMQKHGVPPHQLCFDAVGLGFAVTGYFKGAYEFKANAAPVGDNKANEREYKTLKDQCAYLLADKINYNEIYISGARHKESIIEEVGQLKKKSGQDGKLELIRKGEMKKNIGRSPDFLDTLMMRMVFSLKERKIKVSF